MNNIEISIQITLDGFSFLAQKGGLLVAKGSFAHYDLSAVAQMVGSPDVVRIYCSVPCVEVVPAELFDSSCAYHYLKAANKLSMGDVVLTMYDHDLVVVWAIASSLYDQVQAQWPCAEWRHPLGEISASEDGQSIQVLLDGRVAHVAVFDDLGLCAIKSVQYNDAQDLLYVVRRMSKMDLLGAYRLVMVGVIDGGMQELFGRYYSNVEMVENSAFLLER